MNKSRMSVFNPPSTDSPIDLSGFKPAPPRSAPTGAAIDEMHETSRFQRRDPETAATQTASEDRQSTARKPMVYRTGRNLTFSVKTRPETMDVFYRVAQVQGWKAAETFEKAVELLEDFLKTPPGSSR